MKSHKIVTIIAVVLLVVIIFVASFFGIYKKEEYAVKDVVPEYLLGMEFTNSRIVNLKVDTGIESTTIYDKDGNEVTEKQEGVEYTEENGYKIVENKVNSEDKLTKENYKIVKDIIAKRLKLLGTEQYTIRQDENNGNIKIKMVENDSTNKIINTLTQKGTFELRDKETDEVLLDTSNVQSANVVYGQVETGTAAYLQIKLDKAGKEKLEQISKTYIETTTQTTDENGESKEETTTKEVKVLFNGEEYTTTHFGETMTNGILDIIVGVASDAETMQEYAVTASEMAIVLNTGILPITYQVTGYTESSSITEMQINIAMYVAITVVLLMVIYLIIKLKAKGILASILQIGYIAILLLILRYTNIKITMEGIAGILISVIINYMYIYKAFRNVTADFIKETTLKISLKLIPIYIVAVVFTFNSIVNISSLGMTLVWGIIMMYLYNLTLTQITVKTIREEENAKK